MVELFQFPGYMSHLFRFLGHSLILIYVEILCYDRHVPRWKSEQPGLPSVVSTPKIEYLMPDARDSLLALLHLWFQICFILFYFLFSRKTGAR